MEKKWYEVSLDELTHREFLKKKLHDDPISEGVREMFRTLNMLLNQFGVRTGEEDDIEAQMVELGLRFLPNTEPRTPQINGYFIHKYNKKLIVDLDGNEWDVVPYGWVSKPYTKHNGTVAYCKWENFITDKKGETEGVSIVRK